MIRALNQGLGIPAEVLIRSDPTAQEKVANALSKPAAKKLRAWALMEEEEAFDAFLVRTLCGTPATAMLRKTRTWRTNAKTDRVALQAWCAAALLRSRDTQVSDRFDNFWFTLLHELAHVAAHLTNGTEVIFDDLEIGSDLDIEQEADEMARVALIPDELWATFNSGADVSTAEVFDHAPHVEATVADGA
jgi:hypothetical protein